MVLLWADRDVRWMFCACVPLRQQFENRTNRLQKYIHEVWKCWANWKTCVTEVMLIYLILHDFQDLEGAGIQK